MRWPWKTSVVLSCRIPPLSGGIHLDRLSDCPGPPQSNKRSALFVVIMMVLWNLPVDAHELGALAFGRDHTGKWWYGSATNKKSKNEATRLAMMRCQRNGQSCKIIRQFSLACFAFAYSKNRVGGFAMGLVREIAERRAINECAKRRGRGCYIDQVLCDSLNEYISAGLRLADAERAQMIRQHADAGQSRTRTACKLSGKTITYATNVCFSGSRCQQQRTLIEIIGDDILYHEGKRGARTGLTFRMGKTLDATEESEELTRTAKFKQRGAGYIPRTHTTASFSSGELFLRIDSVNYAKSNKLFTDDTPVGAFTLVDRIRITNCNTCTLREANTLLVTTGGRELISRDLLGDCRMGSMR